MNFNNFPVHIKNGILFLFATFLLLLAGCEKDIVLDIEEFSHSNDNKILTIAQAKKWWDANNSINFRSEENDTILTALNVRPLWDGAFFTKYLGGEDIILVPFSWQHPISMNERGKLMLVFFHGLETQQIHVRILGYYAPENDYPRQLGEFDVSDFTGYFFQIDHCGKHSNFIRIQNGLITKRYLADGDFNDLDFRGGGGVRCPSAAGGNSRKPPRRWISPGSVATNGDDSDGGDNTQSGGDIEGGGSIIGPNTSVYWSGFGNFGSNNFGGGGTAGTGSTLSQYFNNQIFNQTHDPVKVQLLEQFRFNYGIHLSVSMLIPMISQFCFDEPESFDGCALWSMVNWAEGYLYLTPQQRSIIEDDSAKLIELITLVHLAYIRNISPLNISVIINSWFALPTASPNDIDDFFILLTAHGINPSALHINTALSPLPPGFKRDWHWWGAQDLTPSKIWEVAGDIKQDLRNRYPSQQAKIYAEFPCQVLGLALEDAVLESLGNHIDRTRELTGTTNNCEPDGFHQFGVADVGNPPPAPFIIEVKGRFSTESNLVFDYSNQMNQFNCYLDYLENNTYRGHETGAHGLYLILPAGVAIAQTIIDQCTARNIPLFWSEIVYKNGDPTQVMVGKPVCMNSSSLNLSGSIVPLAARAFITNHLRIDCNYDMVSLREKILARSQKFETKLSTNSTAPCPED